MIVALLVTVSAALCWVEFGAWRLGYHTISFTSQHNPALRYAVLALIITGALAGSVMWLQHTNGSYGGS